MIRVGGVVVAAAICLCMGVPAAAETSGCVIDPASGMPVSRSSVGICVAGAEGRTVVLESSRSGLLIVSSKSRENDVVAADLDAPGFLHLYGREADLIFCPAGTLDPMTGAPTADCLWDLQSMSAGRGALVGSGQVFASAVLDRSGSALCPASLTVLGDLTSPGGDDFDLRSSVVLSPNERVTDEGSDETAGCAVTGERIELSYRWGDVVRRGMVDGEGEVALDRPETAPSPLATELGWLNQMGDEEWRLVSSLVRLDDSDWELLHRLMSLEPNEVRTLGDELAANGAAVLTDDGRVVPATGSGLSEQAGTAVTKDQVDSILDNIYNLVITVRNKVNSVYSVVTSVSGRIPNRGDVRALVGNVTDIANLAVIVQRVREVVGGVLAVAAALRDGFDSWYGVGCGSGTGCAGFKADLVGLLGDIQDASVFIQSVSCLDQPGLTIRTLDTSLVEDLVINRAPAVVLYSLYLVLERIAPSGSGGGWRSMVGDVLAEIPESFRSDLLALCVKGSGESVRGSGGLICRILNPEDIGQGLNFAYVVAKRKAMVAKVIDAFLKDDVVAQGGAVAGGGGSAGTNVKNPAKVVSKQAEEIADSLPDNIKDIIDKRNQCLDADESIEDGLRGCEPPISVLLERRLPSAPPLPHPTFNDVTVVVERRLNQVEECQQAGGCSGLNAGNARNYLDEALRRPATVRGYTYLCCSYQELNGGTSHVCPPP